MAGPDNPYTFNHFKAEVLAIAERRIKAKVERRISDIGKLDQCKIKSLVSSDTFTFDDIPADAFLRSRSQNSRNYNWYYYYGMVFQIPFLYSIGGWNIGLELAEELYAHTLRLPDVLNLTRARIPNVHFLVNYFNLVSEGFPVDERILNLVLDEHPNLSTQRLDVILFGKGEGRKRPDFQDLIFSPELLRNSK